MRMQEIKDCLEMYHAPVMRCAIDFKNCVYDFEYSYLYGYREHNGYNVPIYRRVDMFASYIEKNGDITDVAYEIKTSVPDFKVSLWEEFFLNDLQRTMPKDRT